MMSKIEPNDAREERIAMEAIVDCYDEYEQAMGWYYYLEDRINFPFQAKWVSRQKPEGRDVKVLEMSPEDECSSDMFVEVLYQEGELEDVFSARLSDIQPLDNESLTEEAIEAIGDWHYWIERGYQF